MSVERPIDRYSPQFYGEYGFDPETNVRVLQTENITKTFGWLWRKEGGLVLIDNDGTLNRNMLDDFRYKRGYPKKVIDLVEELDNQDNWVVSIVSNRNIRDSYFDNNVSGGLYSPERIRIANHYKCDLEAVDDISNCLLSKNAMELAYGFGIYGIGDRWEDLKYLNRQVNSIKKMDGGHNFDVSFIKLPSPDYDKFTFITKFVG